MAKRVTKKIPTNLTLVDIEVVRDDETTTATKPTSRRKGARVAKEAEVAPEANGDRIDAHSAPVAGTKGKAKKASPKTTEVLTMARLRDLYLDHLERVGKSLGTRFSYGIDLAVACGVLGEDTRVADLTVDDVRRYYDSPAVTKTRGGKDKAPVTTAKMRRVLRLALVWAAKEGMIDTAPIPMDPLPPRAAGSKAPAEQVATESSDPS